jgi:hypothetical protein
MRCPAISFILGVFLGVAPAAADEAVRPLAVRIAAAVNGGTVARTGPAEWTLGDRITLYLVVESAVEGEERAAFFTSAPALELDGETVDAALVRPWPPAEAPLEIRWYEVANLVQRETPGAAWEDFEEVEIAGARGAWQADVRPGAAAGLPGVPAGVGTGHYAVAVRRADGVDLRSAGAAALIGVAGRPADVFRVTLRRDDSFAGWICAFWGVPYRHDADDGLISQFAAVNGPGLALGAYRAWTGARLPGVQRPPFDRGPWRTFIEEVHDNVAGGAGPLHGPEGESVEWGQSRYAVRTGDLVSARGRLAVLWSDSGPEGEPDGLLGGEDLVVAADGAPPEIVPLREALPGPLRVSRFRDFTFIQIHLRTLGHYEGEDTGRFDSATQDALTGFQVEQGLPASGQPDRSTLVALIRAHRMALQD